MRQTDGGDSLNFGKYGLCVDLQTLDTWLTPFENNFNSYEFIHPYCFPTHNMCFGGSSYEYSKMRSNVNLVGMLGLFSALLTTFHSYSGPVRNMKYFKRAKRNGAMKVGAYFDWVARNRSTLNSTYTNMYIHPLWKDKYRQEYTNFFGS